MFRPLIPTEETEGSCSAAAGAFVRETQAPRRTGGWGRASVTAPSECRLASTLGGLADNSFFSKHRTGAFLRSHDRNRVRPKTDGVQPLGQNTRRESDRGGAGLQSDSSPSRRPTATAERKQEEQLTCPHLHILQLIGPRFRRRQSGSSQPFEKRSAATSESFRNRI